MVTVSDDTDADVIPMTFAHTETKEAAMALVELLEWLKDKTGPTTAIVLAAANGDEIFFEWFGDFETIDHFRERLSREQMLEAFDEE